MGSCFVEKLSKKRLKKAVIQDDEPKVARKKNIDVFTEEVETVAELHSNQVTDLLQNYNNTLTAANQQHKPSTKVVSPSDINRQSIIDELEQKQNDEDVLNKIDNV